MAMISTSRKRTRSLPWTNSGGIPTICLITDPLEKVSTVLDKPFPFSKLLIETVGAQCLLSSSEFSLLSVIVDIDPDFGVTGNHELRKHTAIFYTYHKAIQILLRHFFTTEVQTTSDKSTLFRGASLATAIFAEYFNNQAPIYIQNITLPLISHICSSNGSWEVNPKRETDIKVSQQNVETLKMLITGFLDRIFATELPLTITSILGFIRQQIVFKFGESEADEVLPSFFFLRFVCPIVISPERFNIRNSIPTKEARRGLVIASKVLQQLATREEFTEAKEEYMCDFNVILRSYKGRFRRFVKLLSKQNRSDIGEEPGLIPKPMYDTSLDYFRTFLTLNYDEIKARLIIMDEEATVLLEEFKETPLLRVHSETLSNKRDESDVNETTNVKLLSLKSLLQEETCNRMSVEEELEAATKKLIKLESLLNKCNCKC